MQAGGAIRTWLKRVVPWLTAAALLAYVFHSVPFGRTWAAVRAVGPASVLGLLLVYFLYSYAADVLATWATFRWFCARLRLWDVVAIRGVTYLLAIVNYNLGQGGIVYVVGRQRGVGLARATGTVLLTMGMMFVDLLLLAAAGSFLGDPADPRLRTMRWVSSAGLAAFGLYLGVIALRPGFLRRRRLLQPLFDAGIGGHVKAGLVRLPHVAGHVAFQWLLLRLFNVALPFSAAAMLLPIVLVIAWVPITVQGLGTQQVAAMELLGRYALAPSVAAQKAQVVAFSLTQTAVFVCFSLITGLLFLRGATAARATSAAPETPVSDLESL